MKSKRKMILLYIITLIILFGVISIVINNYSSKYNIKMYSSHKKTSIIDKKQNTIVYYPYFKDDKVNKIVKSYVFDYVKKYKLTSSNNKKLNINYEINNFDNYVNIVFYIDNSLSNIKNHNILIDINKKEKIKITDLINKEELESEIVKEVHNKYDDDISKKVEKSNINDFTYIFKNNTLLVYFNNIDSKEKPFIKINLESKMVFKDISKIKYVAFTFDDGPSLYTSEILDILESSGSSATFFEIGKNMKNNEEIVKKIYLSNSEVGTHSYSHKDLTTLKTSSLLSEINTSSIIYNSITKDNLKYIRPPYGKYNKKVLSYSAYPVILWSIDTKDWKHGDKDKTINNIIKNVEDGSIILMHDSVKSTVDAVCEVIPMLNDMNYEVVSVSKLLEKNNITLKNGEVLSKIN